MLAPIGIAAPAARTAISRMVRQGWLEPVRLYDGPGYALTERAGQRLDDAGARIYGTRDLRWSGAWDLLVVTTPVHRSERDRVRSGLRFLGYAPLSESTWISPFHSTEVEQLLASEGVSCSRFWADDADPLARARQAWDLGALAAAYDTWHREATDLIRHSPLTVRADSSDDDAEQAFATRSLLVHEWRKFLFSDPGLPAQLLPPDWPGHSAAMFFAQEASRLLPAASSFVDRCLRPRST